MVFTAILLFAGLLVLAMRVAYLAVLKGEDYRLAAEDNLDSVRRLEAPRGNIFDRNGEPLALSRKAYSVSYRSYGHSAAQVRRVLSDLAPLAGQGVMDHYDVALENTTCGVPSRLARRLPQSSVIALMERPRDFPGVWVQEDYRREYPRGPAMASIVGFTGKIPPEEIDQYHPPVYLADAFVGRMGLEKQYEDRLVGKPGRERLRRDREDPIIDEAARPGDDLWLTIDSELQQFACETLAGTHGSLVMMDVRSGALLVLATSPTFDPMRPWMTEIDGVPVSFLNRTWQGAYAPGSTFKLVSATAALRNGWDLDRSVFCRGFHQLPGWERPFWCDARSGHGPTSLRNAVKWSCNAYFYELGIDIGGEKILGEAESFGFGTETGLDLPAERSGNLRLNGQSPGDGETLNLSIGQGALLATPLQVAVAFAALANGGDILKPFVVAEIGPGDGGPSVRTRPEVRRRVEWTGQERDLLVDGFFAVINEPGGTANKIGFPEQWEACGKTGTAENGRGGTDAWFVCFLPRRDPEWVVVGHVEDAEGHGGEVAGPLVRDLIARSRGETLSGPSEEEPDFSTAESPDEGDSALFGEMGDEGVVAPL